MTALVSPSYVRTMAAYNAEMNRRLYDASARIADAERRKHRGAFWGSLHGTLCHLLWGDQMWMSRFDNWPKAAAIQKDSATLIADFDELRRLRVDADDKISAWAAQVSDTWLADDMVQLVGAARNALAAELRGDAFFQPPDPPSRPGPRTDHRLRREDRRYRFVFGGARPGLTAMERPCRDLDPSS